VVDTSVSSSDIIYYCVVVVVVVVGVVVGVFGCRYKGGIWSVELYFMLALVDI